MTNKHKLNQLISLISIRAILLALVIMLYIAGQTVTSITILSIWLFIEALVLRDHKQINEVAVGVHSALQHHNLKDTSYLKFFRSIDEDFDFYKEYEEIFNFNLNSGADVPFMVKLFENPDYDWFFPSIFHGRHGLKEHDFAHLLLSRGFNIVDEICVVGTTAGSSKKMNWFNTPVFYLAQWIFYPRVFRFPLKYYPIWRAYVRYGSLLKKDISKITPQDFKGKSALEVRAEMGVFKANLIPIYKQEALNYGVNARLLDGLVVSQEEMLSIEMNTTDIVISSQLLADDLFYPPVINTVSRNLLSGTKYKWIVPNTKEMKLKIQALKAIHSDHENMSIAIISQKDYEDNYGEAEDILFYDGVISLFKTGHDQYLIKAI